MGFLTMSDLFREVTSVSWFGRIKRAVGGVFVGLLLIVLMVVGLFWNEGRAVQTARSLAEGAGAVVSVDADSVDAGDDGRLVHVTGTVTASSGLSDPDFGISAQGLRLSRSVEMYQWKEEQKSETTNKLGGGEETVTTYSYSKAWDDQPIASSGFKKPDGHENPPMQIRGRQFQIPQGKLGAFTLDQPVLDRIEGDEAFTLSPDQAAAIGGAYSVTSGSTSSTARSISALTPRRRRSAIIASATNWRRSAWSASSGVRAAASLRPTRRPPATPC